MALDGLLLILGMALLVVGGRALVSGASRLAAGLGVSELAIGLTVVAFGTSAPELAVNGLAAVRGSGAIAFGNVVGLRTGRMKGRPLPGKRAENMALGEQRAPRTACEEVGGGASDDRVRGRLSSARPAAPGRPSGRRCRSPL